MLELTYITINTSDSRLSPRDETVAMLKPVVAAGGGEIAGLHVDFESNSVFTLGWRPDMPAVRCYLAKEPNPVLWTRTGGQGPEPAAPWGAANGSTGRGSTCKAWLAVRILPDALRCTPDEIFMLAGLTLEGRR